MKIKVYLTHDCGFHGSHLELEEGAGCCSEGCVVGDYEMELINDNDEVITYFVPERGMDGVNETIDLWKSEHGNLNIEYIE